MPRFLLCCAVVCAVCPAPLLAADTPDWSKFQAVKMFEVDRYCEGVVFDHEGKGYISHNKSITWFTDDGKHDTWMTATTDKATGAPNGHKVLSDGTHLVCDASHHAVLHLSPEGKILGYASKECEGKALRGPNDLTLDSPNGGFYFTDPGESTLEKPIGTVHYVDAQGKTTLVDSGLAFPNGIVLTADGKKLYVAESQKNCVHVYDVTGPGKTDKRKLFADLPKHTSGDYMRSQPDGMCLDAAGNLYIAHYGMQQVQVLDPSGKLIARLPGGNETTSNVAFGGPKFDQLFVTGGIGKEDGPGGLFRLDLGVKGLAILPPRKLTDTTGATAISVTVVAQANAQPKPTVKEGKPIEGSILTPKPGDEDEFHPGPYEFGEDSKRQAGIPKGTVTQHKWENSKIYPGTVRDYWVYVPAQYNKEKPACVMVFQDGGGYQSETGQYRSTIVMDNLIHEGAIPVMIGIFINPGNIPAAEKTQKDRSNRSFEYDTLSDQYSKFLMEEILPEVSKSYNLTKDPEGRGIGGASSGGICAFTVAWERPNEFRKVLSHIGSYTNIRGGHNYQALIRKTEKKPLRIFLQDGNKDLNNLHGNWYLANLEMASSLKFAGYDYKCVIGEEGHNGKHGGAILPESMRWLWRGYGLQEEGKEEGK